MQEPIRWTRERAEAAFWEEVEMVETAEELDDALGMFLYRLALATEAPRERAN